MHIKEASSDLYGDGIKWSSIENTEPDWDLVGEFSPIELTGLLLITVF